MADFSIEQGIHNQGYCRVAGVDEVGRGAWAGPVFAAVEQEVPCFPPRPT